MLAFQIVRCRSHALFVELLCGGLLVLLSLSLPSIAPAEAAMPGTPWAWGRNQAGQLGDGMPQHFRETPLPVLDRPGHELTGVIEIAASYGHSLALKSDSTVWVWGFNIPTPVQVLDRAIAVGAGSFGCVALREDSTVWTWICENPTPNPVPVRDRTGRNLSGVVKIAVGIAHALALKEDGTVWAWGNNRAGQLGIPPTHVPRNTADQVTPLPEIIAIAAGGGHNLALTRDHRVLAWGGNDVGQLGVDPSTTPPCAPTYEPCRYTPAPVRSLPHVKDIAAGGLHNLALEPNGTVWAWGYNMYGQLGDGHQRIRSNPTPAPVRLPPGVGAAAIAAGVDHSLALSNGMLWGWGKNDTGQLATPVTPTTREFSTPIRLSSPASVNAIAAGALAEHSLAIVRAEPPPRVDRCRQDPWLCRYDPRLEPGVIVLECLLRHCLVVDRIPENCRRKFSCPGCSAGGLCPPFYHVFLDGLDDVWNVGLFDAEGTLVQYQQFKTPTGIVISFRPSKGRYIEGLVGDYLLVFEMGPKGKLGVKYKVRTRLERSDKPYAPERAKRAD